MKFFGREEEIAELRRIRDIAARSARMTILTGRRRVGKTRFRREELERKVAAFFTKHPELKDYKNSIRCLSFEDM